MNYIDRRINEIVNHISHFKSSMVHGKSKEYFDSLRSGIRTLEGIIGFIERSTPETIKHFTIKEFEAELNRIKRM